MRLIEIARRTSGACVLAVLSGCSPLFWALMHTGGAEGGGGTLALAQPVEGSTDDDEDSVRLTCGSPDGAGDESWTFAPEAAGRYRVHVDGQYDCAVGVLDPDRREIACNDDTGQSSISEVVVDLQAGLRYAIVVDGYRDNEGGYRLRVDPAGAAAPTNPSSTPPTPPVATPPAVVPEDPTAMQARCASAPPLGTGSTSGEIAPSLATARTSCGSGPGGDAVYRVVVSSRSRVTVKLEATFDGILELRSGCSPGPVIACNDDTGDALHSQVSAVLDPGTYYLVVDTYEERLGGAFVLQLHVEPP